MVKRSTGGGPRHASQFLGKVTRRVLGRRGLNEAEVVLRWPAIVGEALARQCLPEKLSFPRSAGAGGILHLRVSPAAALEIQHLEPTILERVNTYYGYRCVARLKLRQQPLPKAPAPVPRERLELDARTRASIEARVAATTDSELRQALRDLGLSVASKKRP